MPSEGKIRRSSTENYDYLWKIVLIGESGVGKTCLIRRLNDGVFPDSSVSTIGVDFAFFSTKLGGKDIKLQVWDTAGQERFSAIVPTYFRNALGFVVAFDVTNRASFQNCEKWLARARACCPESAVIIVGTKTDLEAERVVSEEEASNYATQRGARYMGVSAKSGTNVQECLCDLVNKIYTSPALLTAADHPDRKSVV